MAANVCGNHLGEYLGSLAFIIRGLIDPSSLEVIACREALSLAEDLGLQKLHCVMVVKHIKKALGGSYDGVIIEIKS